MSNLPGNPHADAAREAYKNAANHRAQIEATLALAYEQRTANLIALADLTMHGGLNPDYDMETIYNRLGLGDNND